MKSLPLMLIVLTTLVVGSVVADLKTETFTRASMLTGMGSTGINAVTQYQGDKRMEDNTTKLVGGVGGMFAGKPQTSVEITRLDKDLIWDLNRPRKPTPSARLPCPPGPKPGPSEDRAARSRSPTRS